MQDKTFPYLCRHYLRGHCLHAGTAGPVGEDSLRCSRMAELLRYWDDFLDRAENFGLAEEEAAVIWQRLADKRVSSLVPCSRRSAAMPGPGSGQRDFTDCPHLAEGLCLLILPRCSGLCSFFAGREPF